MLGKLVLAALLALPASAQEGAFNSACFYGLSDADTPATLNPCESPDLLNTESNLGGTALLKRKGFAKVADLTIATSAVSGSHSFIDSSGNRLDIVCQDKNCAKSTNGNAFSTFLTTAGGTGAVPTRWSFVDVGGILYGANDRRDPIMKYDGTTRSSPTGMPLGSILEMTQDRLAIGDISGLPNRVHFSSAGAYEQFTTGANRQDSFYDDIGSDGDRIRGIKCIGGNCFIFKTASITLCEMDDQYNTICSVISPVIGTTDPASIVAAGSSLYFRAQDKNYWEIASGGLRQISKKIPNLVKSQSGGLGGGENTNTQTTQADWQAATQRPTGSWDTTTTNGSIFPSSVTAIDTSSADFAAGTLVNVTTESVQGSVVLSSHNWRDDWANSYTTGRTTWTVTSGNMITASSFFRTAGNGTNVSNNAQVDISTGHWQLSYKYNENTSVGNTCHQSGGTICLGFRFIKKGNGDYYSVEVVPAGGSSNHTIRIVKNASSVRTVLSNSANVIINSDQIVAFSVDRTTDGRTYVLADGVLVASTTDTSVTGQGYLEFVMEELDTPHVWTQFVSGFYAYQYYPTGTVTSRIFDTAFSTPTWGSLSSTFTARNDLNDGNIAFYVQSSTANDGGGFTSLLSASDTFRPATLAQNRYFRYQAQFQTFSSTKTPQLDAISLLAATTGQLITQCIQPNASISAWGTLSCAETKAGAGSLVYYATSALTCAALPTADPTDATKWPAGAVTNNATLSISTNTAVKIAWRSLLGSATDQAQVDACVLTWNEGTPNQPAWAAYDSVKNAIYWTSTVGGASYTNRLLKYDRNLQQWYPFDIRAQAPRVINNSLYFGGASSGTWNLYGLVDADAGNAINAYFKTKDFGSEQPFLEKNFKTVSVLTRNNGSGSMTGTWTNSIGVSGAFNISLSTGAGITYARSLYRLPLKSPQQFMNIQLGNNSSTPFEILGLSVDWMASPWKVP